MRKNFVQSMAKQLKAKLHEESKFWRALQPFPNQSSMQGRESEKKSNNQQFCMAMRNFRKACEMPTRSTSCRIESKAVKNQFRTLEKFRKPCETKENEFRNPLRNFRKPRRNFTSLAKLMNFVSLEKLMNFVTPFEIFATLRNLQIFLHRLRQIFISRYFV